MALPFATKGLNGCPFFFGKPALVHARSSQPELSRSADRFWRGSPADVSRQTASAGRVSGAATARWISPPAENRDSAINPFFAQTIGGDKMRCRGGPIATRL
jgi:hypothetical protein